jgi:hypothetical protein
MGIAALHPSYALVTSEPHRSFGQSLIGETWEMEL